MPIEVIGKEFVDTNINILKEAATCPSLSGRSTLEYQIGCTPDSEVLFRINKNSGTGKFNSEWISTNAILQLIEEAGGPFYSSLLTRLYEKKSVNSAGFLLSILKQEGLVQALEDGGYERTKKDIKTLIKKPSRRAKS